MPMSAGLIRSFWPIRSKAIPAQLGDPAEWIAEWKWDGIRSQMIRRSWQTFIWSRGEELVTERFPELEALGGLLPEGTVIDGEILPWKDGLPLPFAQMQRRIGRKVLGPKILAECRSCCSLTICWNGRAKTSGSGRSSSAASSWPNACAQSTG